MAANKTIKIVSLVIVAGLLYVSAYQLGATANTPMVEIENVIWHITKFGFWLCVVTFCVMLFWQMFASGEK